MAGDKGSRRFIRLWWVLAFTAGAIAGALSISLIGPQDTIWWIAGVCGSVMAVTAIFEGYGDGGLALARRSPRPRRHALQGPPQMAGRKSAKPKAPLRRGRLRAINGKKIAEPPPGGEA
ncbi:MAG: hypothetical protein ABSG46_01900 [Candidatus Binataceae bacterium]|jgi:hypothetical protein